ncbi:hypothetical protein DFH09DRAFT_600635 [Mycena vulgaris]|nr:hypothetical protein DFH09DRAFT_600635 [Mycena vulgaris]
MSFTFRPARAGPAGNVFLAVSGLNEKKALGGPPHENGGQVEWRSHATHSNLPAPLQELPYPFPPPLLSVPFGVASQGHLTGGGTSIPGQYSAADDFNYSAWVHDQPYVGNGVSPAQSFGNINTYDTSSNASRLPPQDALPGLPLLDAASFSVYPENQEAIVLPQTTNGELPINPSLPILFEHLEEMLASMLERGSQLLPPSHFSTGPETPLPSCVAPSDLALVPSSSAKRISVPHAPSIVSPSPPSVAAPQHPYFPGPSHTAGHMGAFPYPYPYPYDGEIYPGIPFSPSPSSYGSASPDIPRRALPYPMVHRDTTPVSRLASPDAYPMPLVAGPFNPTPAYTRRDEITEERARGRQIKRQDRRHNLWPSNLRTPPSHTHPATARASGLSQKEKLMSWSQSRTKSGGPRPPHSPAPGTRAGRLWRQRV